MTIRDTTQLEAIQVWGEERRGTVILPTGYGKTRCGVMARVSLGNPKTLVITSRVPLIKQWQDEFGTEVSNIDFLCIQTAYKIIADYDLVIIDEVHRSLSPKYRAVFENITYKWILCLTATKPKEQEYLDVLYKYAPIRYEKTLHEAVDSQVLPDFTIINCEVPFAKEQKYKYAMWDKQFHEAVISIMRMRHADESLSRKYKSAFEIAKDFKDAKENSPLKQMSRQFWTAMTMRKHAVYNNTAKLTIAVNIVNAHPQRKWLLFVKSIKFAEDLGKLIPNSLIYHSKLNKQERAHILEMFSSGAVRRLIAVDALNEGLDVADVDAAICLSGVSTELTNVQQIGRLLRKKEIKPVFINFFTADTVEKGWVESKTSKSGLKKYVWYANLSRIYQSLERT